MVHLCILTSLQHINGWEKDCVTAVFNEELPSQSTTTLSGVDSWLLLPVRTRAVHGNSTRGFAAHNFSIRPPERELALPLETARRRRRRRRRPWTKFLHGVALQISRSHRKRTQFPRPDARSIAMSSNYPDSAMGKTTKARTRAPAGSAFNPIRAASRSSTTTA